MNNKYNGLTYVNELSECAYERLYKLYKRKFGKEIHSYGIDEKLLKRQIKVKSLNEVESDFNFILVYDLSQMK